MIIDRPTYLIAELAGDVEPLVYGLRRRFNPERMSWPVDISIVGSSGVGTTDCEHILLCCLKTQKYALGGVLSGRINMNSKTFIGRFSDIASLDKQEQAVLLERARHEAFVNLGLSGRAALYMVGCMLLGFTIAIVPPLLLGFTIVVQLLSLAVGTVASGYLYRRLYRSILSRGLENILAQ